MNCPRVRIWTEIFCTFALSTSHHHGPRPLLINRDSQKRVTLVVSKANIESRRISINQTVLKNQRLYFIAHFNPLDTLRRFNHVVCSRMQTVGLGEITVYAGAQIVGLANVNHSACTILKLVRTWCFRYYTRWALHNRELFLCNLFGLHGLRVIQDWR